MPRPAGRCREACPPGHADHDLRVSLRLSGFDTKPGVAGAKPQKAVTPLTTVHDHPPGNSYLALVGHAPCSADQLGADHFGCSLVVVALGQDCSIAAYGESVRGTYGAGPAGHLTRGGGDPRQERASASAAGVPDQPHPVALAGGGAALQGRVRKTASRGPYRLTFGTPAGKPGCRLRMSSVDAFITVGRPDRSAAVGHQNRDVVADTEGALLLALHRPHHSVRLPRARVLPASATANYEEPRVREKGDVTGPDLYVLDHSALNCTVSLADHQSSIEWNLRAPSHPALDVAASA